MLNEQDMQFITEADKAFQSGLTIDQTAELLGCNKNTLYSRIRTLGYKIEKYGKLVPIHAPDLSNDQAA